MKKPPPPAPRAQEPKGAQTRPAGARNPGKRGAELTRALQEQAFFLNVIEAKSCRQIAEVMGIAPDTASKYIRAEGKRRAADLEATYESEKARSIAFYDEVAARGLTLAQKADDAFMQPLIKGLDSAVHARERRDKILGLDAAVKIDAGLQPLIDALTSAGDESAKPLE